MNLKNQKTFNEKLQWLKLNDRKPEYTKLVDKLEVKRIVAEKIGEEYIIPHWAFGIIVTKLILSLCLISL